MEARTDGTLPESDTHATALLSDRLRLRLPSCSVAHSLCELALSPLASDLIYEKGLNNVTVDELVLATQQKANDAVPPKVKKEVMEVSRAAE